MPDIFSPQPSAEAAADQSIINSVDALNKGNFSFFSTYCELPDGIQYQGEDPGELILLLLRRDFVTNAPWLLTALIALILPLFLFPFLQNLNFIEIIPGRYVLIIIISYIVFILGYALYSFISWFYNISVVTDRDVVDVDYTNVTYKDISVATYEAIQDVNYAQSGFLRNFFNYGDIFVQTAGEKENIEFLKVPNPGKVADIINDQKKKIFSRKPHYDKQQL